MKKTSKFTCTGSRRIGNTKPFKHFKLIEPLLRKGLRPNEIKKRCPNLTSNQIKNVRAAIGLPKFTKRVKGFGKAQLQMKKWREGIMLDMLADDFSVKEIADVLGVTRQRISYAIKHELQ